MTSPYDIVMFGLSITSSWGNGHATTYRGLVRELAVRGHHILFLERDAPWFAENRDMPSPSFCEARIYNSVEELKDLFSSTIRWADVVIVGSSIPQGVSVGDWVTTTADGITMFYDLDTPMTLARLASQNYEYLHPFLIPRYNMYLSCSGGPLLKEIENHYGSPMAKPLYCCVDPAVHFPGETEIKYDLGFLGSYSDDRQPAVERFLIEPAKQWQEGRFSIAGSQYPENILWPRNVKYFQHLPPSQHGDYYNSLRFALNVTRADWIKAGYSPSVRLFEAAACGIPVISDNWPGLDNFFVPDKEIFIADSTEKVLFHLKETPESVRIRMGKFAGKRILARHTAAHRAEELEKYIADLKRTPARITIADVKNENIFTTPAQTPQNE